MVDLSLVHRRVELDRRPLGRGQRCHADLHQFLRRERRSRLPDAVRQRRRRYRPHAVHAAGSTRPRSWPTFQVLCPVAAPTWSRACIEGGTRSGRFPTVNSRACASSCCSPTARPTACPGSTPGMRPRGRCEPTTSRTTAPIRTARPTVRPDILRDSMTRSVSGAASPQRAFNLRDGIALLRAATVVCPQCRCSLRGPEHGTTPIEARASRRAFDLQSSTLKVNGVRRTA